MKKITLYTDGHGRFCKEARSWLEKHRLEFEEKDVKSAKNLEELFQISRQYAVPVVVSGDNVILGFNEQKLKRILLGS